MGFFSDSVNEAIPPFESPLSFSGVSPVVVHAAQIRSTSDKDKRIGAVSIVHLSPCFLPTCYLHRPLGCIYELFFQRNCSC